MHVREQVAAAIVDRLRAEIPAFGGRVYSHGNVGWDLRTHPVAFVTGMASKVSVEPGSNERMQRRDLEVLVEIADLDETGGDYVARIGDLSAAVELSLDGLGDVIPIEEVVCTGDTGVQDIGDDERGVSAAIGMTFAVSFYTARGNATAFLAP